MSAAPAPAPQPIIAPSLPLSFTPVFHANLTLGKSSKPIPVPGGILINEPITGGTVSGPAINGTIKSGFAHPPIYENGTLQVAIIDVYGTTDDGQAFHIHEEGVGTNPEQVTRIVRFLLDGVARRKFPGRADRTEQQIYVSGAKHKQLNDGYVLATVNLNKNRIAVAVQDFWWRI
jgi:hypothetical protein